MANDLNRAFQNLVIGNKCKYIYVCMCRFIYLCIYVCMCTYTLVIEILTKMLKDKNYEHLQSYE